MESKLNNYYIGYAPHSEDFLHAGDRRRFVWYAKNRGVNFEIAKPENNYDIVFKAHSKIKQKKLSEQLSE